MIVVAGGKCVGRGHAGIATPCQDAYATKVLGSVGCVALADGAGSRKHSDRGAQVCVDAVSGFVAKQFDTLVRLSESRPAAVREMILQCAVVALRRYVRRKKYGIEDLACTLLFAAFKDGHVLAGHLGDGVIGVLNGAEVRVLSLPENGEYANSTFFVTDKGASSHLRIYQFEVSGSVGLMLMSDGTAESLFNRSTKDLAPAVTTIFSWARKLPAKELSAVLTQNLEQIFRAKTSDDCSVAILVRH
ncbi:MAG: protein phosphatase 2C domain-containing protein [Dechloromonas sp.]|nr:protein phosphatase 2C domain-containing protein [Dechloromonas sp.]